MTSSGLVFCRASRFLRTHPAPDVRQVGLARPQHGHAGGGIGRDLDDRAVEVGHALHEVVGVALEHDAHALFVRLEHERPGPDHGVGMVEVLELLLGLARQDDAERRVGQVIEERRVRILERDAHRVLLHHLDGGHRLEARGEAGFGHEPLERELDVLGRDLPAVDRRLVVELDALAQGEGVDLAVLGHRPLLGEVGQDREIRRALLLGPVGEPHQLAVGEAHVGVREEADRQVRIEPGRLPLGDANDTTLLGRLSVGGRDREQKQDGQQQRDDGGATGHGSSSVRPARVAHYEQAAPLVNSARIRGGFEPPDGGDVSRFSGGDRGGRAARRPAC